MKENFIFEPQEFLTEYLPEFIQKREKDLICAKQFYAQNDLESVLKICHRIHGIAAPYGMSPLGELARKVIDNCRQQNPRPIAELLESMQHYLEFVKAKADKGSTK